MTLNYYILENATSFGIDIDGNLIGFYEDGYEQTGISLSGHHLETWKLGVKTDKKNMDNIKLFKEMGFAHTIKPLD